MSGLSIRGWAALTPWDDALSGEARPGDAVAVTDLYAEPLPSPQTRAILNFDTRERLGRKGTSQLTRAAAMAIVSTGAALDDSGIDVAAHRARIGVALGTSTGSLRSTMEFSKDTLVQERPYLVDPGAFPNTVLNQAAGRLAIWHGLAGPNATIAGGRVAFLGALSFAARAIRRDRADVVVTGAVEEFTPHYAWMAHHTLGAKAVPSEAAAAFVVRSRHDARDDADLVAMTTGFAPGQTAAARHSALAAVVDELRRAAGDDIEVVFTSSSDCEELDAVAALVDAGAELRAVNLEFGDCDAASAAVALAAILGEHRGWVRPRRPASTADLDVAATVASAPR